ncbi:ppg3 [Cystoisospora suis]|uniref:Ppg3 n=1 Tax=Cystoisospora suis TaxID=483139 RepID=A0A2C6KUU6_9APIC|nr:ppg3 [Cystoisospora suis]
MSRQKYTFVTLSSSVPVPGVAASLRSPCYGPCQDRSDSLSLSEAPTRSAVDTVGSTSCVSATTSQVNGARAGGGHGEVEHCVGGHSSRDPIRSEDSRVASQAVGTITQTATRGDKAPVGPCEALRTVSPFPTVQKKFGELLPFSGTSLSGEADKTLASLHSSEPLTRPRQSIDTAAEAPGSGTQGARLPVPACLDGDGDERKSAGLLPGNDLGSSGKGILAACSPKEKLCGSQGVSFCEGDSSSSVSKREGVSFSFSLQNRSSLSSGNVSEVRLVGPQRTVYSSSLRVPSLALPSSFEDAPLPAVAREDAAAMLRDFATLLQRLERLGSHHRQLQQSIQIRSCSVSSSSPQLSAVSRAELVEARRQLKQHAVVCASVSARLGRLFSEDHEMISAHGTNSAAARTTQGNGEENKKNNGMSMLVQGHDSRTEEEKSSLRLGDSKRTDEATGRGSDEGGAAANQRRRLLLSKLRQDFLRLQQHHERLMLLFDSHAFSLHLEEPSEHCLVRSSGPRQEEGSGPNLLVKKERGQTPGLLALIDFGHFAQHESGVTDNSGPRADRSDCSRATLCGVASGPGIAEAGLVTCSKDDSKGHPQRFDEHTSCNRSCSGERRQCLQPTCVAPPTSASSSSSSSSVRSPSCSGAGGLAEPRFLPLPAPEELPSSPLASSFCSFWRPTCLQEVDEGLEEAQRREQLQQLRQLEQCVNVLHELHLQVASDVAAAEEPLLAAADEGESACVEIAQANRELISASMRRSRWWGVQGGGAAAAAGAIVGVVAGGPIGLAAGAVVGAFLGASSGTALKREHRRKLTGLKKEIEGRRRGRRERREGGDGRAGVTFGPGDSQTGVLLEDVSDTFCHSEGPFNQHTSSQSCLCPPEVSSSCPTGTLSSAPGLRSPPVLSSCRSHPRLSGSHSGAQFSSSRFRVVVYDGSWTAPVSRRMLALSV